ncbi:heterokaryon incompatibility protein-domain-containing protein [Annulohypoxylon nitens]|nr:heterokaryon incompatibility protein-domain-containing protein [Annulohypoxylon nitens]
MRLINTKSSDYKMKEFFGDEIPPYAILSHTWKQDEEVTFQEWQNMDSPSIRQKPGFIKITDTCRQAKLDGFDWLWVDTNCIDKSSSAELTEAINSMFTWYRDAKICYAYLQDVPSNGHHGQSEEVMSLFKQSRWFHRGWTLQELLAPKKVIFYTKDWKKIGSKEPLASKKDKSPTSEKDESLTSKIAEITGIDETYLDGSTALRMSSVAKRLSWIANRKTTRVEDIAYCLLGIFDINMPLLYGEGIKAFTRLQQEIVRSSSDHTIFCWTWDSDVPSEWVSMLAPSPKQFLGSGEYVRKDGVAKLKPYSMTNIGLSIQLPVVYSSRIVYAILNVGKEFGEHYEYVAIPLRTVRSRAQFDRYYFPEAPILLDKPMLAGRHRHSTGMSGEHLIVRSIHDGPGTSPTSLQVSRYNILILVDPECSFLHIKGGSLSSTSETDYFDLESRDFGFGAAREAAETGDIIRLRKVKDSNTAVYATVARIKNKRTHHHADVLFALKLGSNGANFPSWYCHILSDRYHGDSRSSSKTLKQSVLEILDKFNASGAGSAQTRDIAQDKTWCVKLGGTVLANDKTEVRIVRICNDREFYEDEGGYFGDETPSDTDAAESSIAESKTKVKRLMTERGDAFSSF